jgi:hypothetical protein
MSKFCRAEAVAECKLWVAGDEPTIFFFDFERGGVPPAINYYCSGSVGEFVRGSIFEAEEGWRQKLETSVLCGYGVSFFGERGRERRETNNKT